MTNQPTWRDLPYRTLKRCARLWGISLPRARRLVAEKSITSRIANPVEAVTLLELAEVDSIPHTGVIVIDYAEAVHFTAPMGRHKPAKTAHERRKRRREYARDWMRAKRAKLLKDSTSE